MKKSISAFWALNIALPLLLGLLIYYFWRPDATVSHILYRYFPISGQLPSNLHSRFPLLSKFTSNFACDMLWTYSLVFSLTAILGTSSRRLCCASVIAIIYGFIFELLQLKSIVPGTFDIVDILFEAISSIAAAIYIKQHTKGDPK